MSDNHEHRMDRIARAGQAESFRGLHSLTPIGELGVRGRELSREERSRIFDELFFEGDRRLPYLWRFGALMVFSSTIAALGLLNDSAAVVIGAMLVAPLMTPILGLSAAVVQSWGRRQLESLAILAGGAAIGVFIGWLFFEILPLGDRVTLPDQVLGRTAPNLLDLGIAITAGAAGAYVMIRKEAGSALPGVGIAVALVPPLATLGITVGAGRDDLADGALLLFLTNLTCITLAASIVFLAAGFVPRFRLVLSRRGRRWSLIITLAAVILVAVPITLYTRDRLTELRIKGSVPELIKEWAPNATVKSVSVDISASPALVQVAITSPDAPGDPNVLAQLISHKAGRDIDVEVSYAPQLTGSGTAGH